MERCVSLARCAAICAALAVSCERAPASAPLPTKFSGPLPPGEPQVRATAVVISRSGKVELQRGLQGGWADAQVGDRLAPSDALRTQAGEAEVGVSGVKMRVYEASAVRLKDANDRWLRAQVRGAVESDVEPGMGSVDVEVKAGTVSRVSRGGLEDASPALRRILLSVRWPEERATSKDTVPVSGKVEAGSRVFIQGQPIPVEPGGSFRAEVPLRDGKQTVAVVAIDPLGRRKQVDTTIVRDQSTPTVRVKKKLWQSR